jgi:hypothetical protein
VTDKTSVLAQFAQAIASSVRVQPLPLRLCLACTTLLDTDGGAITLAYTDATRVTLCATDQVAARLEDLQDVLGQGPGAEAYTSGEVTVAALDTADAANRWPVFAEAAFRAVGRPTLYAWPICPGTEVLGVLTLYQAIPRPLRYDLSGGQFVADALGLALFSDPGARAELSAGPWAARARVHQATGFVIAQLGVSADDALALLRAHAYAGNTTLDMIAAAVVEGRLDFTQVDGHAGLDGDENS